MKYEAALQQLIEEQGIESVVTVVCHRWAGLLSEEQIIEEVASMQVLMMQLQLFYGEARVQKIIDEKLELLATRYKEKQAEKVSGFDGVVRK